MKKLLLTISICSIAYAANAQEVALPDIINSTPQKSIDTNLNPEKILQNSGISEYVNRPVIFSSLLFESLSAEMLENAHVKFSEKALKGITPELPKDGSSAPAEQEVQTMSFYLGSLIYKNPTNVSAWINGKKYKLGDSIDDITLNSASANKVELVLKIAGRPVNLDDETWKQNGITVNKQAKELRFNLKPNQRLDLLKMKILAGKGSIEADLKFIEQSLDKDLKKLESAKKEMTELADGLEKIDKGMNAVVDWAEGLEKLSSIKDPQSRKIIEKAMSSKDENAINGAVAELTAAGKTEDAAKLQSFIDTNRNLENLSNNLPKIDSSTKVTPSLTNQKN